jgi:glycosyltransferase involved in cell wall biosynthesis
MVDGVVVNCEAMRRHMVEDEGVPARLIRLCHNGIDTGHFRPSMRARVPELADASLVIGSVSMLRAEKGLNTLLRAFAEARNERPGLRLVLVGEGAERPALEALSRELGITDQCWIPGETSTVASWLGSIDVFVLPSLSEALSNSLMEAMSSGCAVIASRVGGNPELVLHGETGLLFEAGNAEDLAAQLRAMIRNDESRQSMAAAGARRIATEFSLEVSSRRMGEIYSEFLGTSV